MADVRQGRWTAEIDGDFVVFMIGARINSKLQAFRAFTDLGGRRGMNHMLKYLVEPREGAANFWKGSARADVPARLVPVAESAGARQRLKASLGRKQVGDA